MKSKLPKKDISGLKLAATYGLIPNRLGFCGPQAGKEQKILYAFLINGKGQKEARKTLKKFEGAFAYYDLIAKKNKIKNIFDYNVVEAYWIGNKLLDSVSAEDIKEMARKRFVSPVLLNSKEAEKRIQKIPAYVKPHHSFHVLVFGTVTGRIDLKSIELKDICLVGWGKITAFGKNSKRGVQEIAVSYKPLEENDSHISFGKLKTKNISWDRKVVPELKVGNWVSFHWNFAVQVLNSENVKNLEKYTKLSF